MTYPGAPGIDYGDEFGMQGGNDPGCRGAVEWDAVGDGLVNVISELAALRRRHPALRTGDFAPVTASRHALAFERALGRARYVVAINRGRTRAVLDIGGSGTVVWGAGSHDDDRLVVPGRSAVIVRM